jgi:hypothetical protein
LEWLSDRVKERDLFLIWDCSAAHPDKEAKAQAGEAPIAVQFVPLGLKDEWQLLDLRIFGSLKMRAQGLFHDQWIRDPSTELTVAFAISLLHASDHGF